MFRSFTKKLHGLVNLLCLLLQMLLLFYVKLTNTLFFQKCDVKQQKISNFFNFKTESNIGVKQEKCEEISNLKAVLNNKTCPGRKLCVNCLQISPKHESEFCNNCNLSHKDLSSTPLPNTKVTNILELSSKECEIKPIHNNVPDLCESPDVIPPTPPVILKGPNKEKLGRNKSVKRKFNFFETDCKKKSNKRETSTKDNSTNDENIPQGKRKNCQPSTKNPFRKPSSKSISIESSQWTSQGAEGLLDCVLAQSETPVMLSLGESNMHKKSTVVSETKNPRSESKSTTEYLDLTGDDCSRDCHKAIMNPQKENSNKKNEHSRIKSLKDSSSTNLKNNVTPQFDDKVHLLVEKPFPQNESLLELNVLFDKSHSKMKDNQESLPQGKTDEKLNLPLTGKHEEQMQPRHPPNDDEDISTSFLDDLSFDESSLKE